MAVDNTLSPHGGELKVSVASPDDAAHRVAGLKRLAVNDQIAREVIDLSYGFFSPLDGFMGRTDLDSVVRRMTLADGHVWTIPIVFDVSAATVAEHGLREGDPVLLTYQEQPLAVLDIAEIFAYDKEFLARQVYGATQMEHPGCGPHRLPGRPVHRGAGNLGQPADDQPSLRPVLEEPPATAGTVL